MLQPESAEGLTMGVGAFRKAELRVKKAIRAGLKQARVRCMKKYGPGTKARKLRVSKCMRRMAYKLIKWPKGSR